MSQEERVEKFLEKLTELTHEYNLEVTAEGTSPLLYDYIEKDWVEFGGSFFSRKYEARYDD
jgi:hypothetical protein